MISPKYCNTNDILHRLERKEELLKQPYMALGLEHFDDQESNWFAISMREGFQGGWYSKSYLRVYLPLDEQYDAVNQSLAEACQVMGLKYHDMSEKAKAARAAKRDAEAHALDLLDQSMVLEGGELQGFT